MSRPNQVVPAFTTLFRGDIGGSALSLPSGVWTTILFDIEETDGTTTNMYDSATGQITAPRSGWYDIEAQISSTANTDGINIVRNGDINFPVFASNVTSVVQFIKTRCKLSIGETVEIQAHTSLGGNFVDAITTTTPVAHATNAMVTLVKEFDSA